MPTTQQYKTPIPIFVPALSVAAVLLVLFLVGLKEQDALRKDRVEQVIRQHEIIARIVADNMDNSIRQTEASVTRYAQALSQQFQLPQTDSAINQRFAVLTEQRPDGSFRSPREAYKPTEEAGLWIPSYTPLNDSTRRFFVDAKTVTDLYGRGAMSQPFVDTWVLGADGGIAIFWPDEPNFVFEASADMDYRDSEWMQITKPNQNPEHRARWTRLIFDPVSAVWMMSAVAPVFRGSEWVGTAGHDLPLDNLLQRTQLLRQSEGSYFALVTDDERIVASARYAEKIKQSAGTLTLTQLQDDNLVAAVAMARPKLAQHPFQRIKIQNHEVFVAHIPEQDWLLINAIPLDPIANQIENSFANMRNIALTALVAELLIATLILGWSHHRSRRQFNSLARMQQQLARSEYHYRSLVDNIPGIVYRCKKDTYWTMLFLSKTVEKFTGYPASDFIENRVRSFASIIHPDDRERVSALVDNAVERDRPFVLEYRIIDQEGGVRWMLEHGCGMEPTDQNAGELEGVILDITALKVAEEQLRELNESLEMQIDNRTAELRTAISELETFNYAVSHDLKAPVRQVAGFLEAIEEELSGEGNQEIHDMIHRSQNALLRMKEMIASLHAYSLLNKESLTLNIVNINDLLSYIIDQLPAAVRRKVTIEIPPIDDVIADRSMLRIVFHHLLDNAIKFSAQAEHPQVRFIDHSTSAEWMLEIRDNGVGFNPQYQDNMFQLFQRLHTQDAFPGFGVGLALTRKILSLHGGKIRAESQPGQGASFFISIPVKAVYHQKHVVSAAL